MSVPAYRNGRSKKKTAPMAEALKHGH